MVATQARAPLADALAPINTVRFRLREDTHDALRTRPNRIYAQALIDLRGLSVPAIDAYADWLVNQYWDDTPRDRDLVRIGLMAFMDGWDVGYDEGTRDAYEDLDRAG